ncbi:alcohol dehydrogenase catalytic domain-containing protein [Alicyclobacillus sp.]|uniref:zinc-dependent alcohol dehydrogenase n=1 Tax=Alicyclobacillus sp. TaxID=61169 RepID=UPI0025C3CFB8|nr:alcohol dehydrogenase catalytic domain-containing protein [Alicyclobacillus sp.]MCL6516329.1 alcohol dehydrogenase catalytic domain-containing protein [Alicyclobacillus sp.]
MKALCKQTWQPGMALVDVPVPEPAAGAVRLRVVGSAICGSDLHIYESAPGYEWLSLPVTPGHEVAGVVDAVGPGVNPAWIGRRAVVNPYIPCGDCRQCRAGRPNLCDGGRATLEKVPSQALQIGFRRPGGMAEYVTAPVENLLPLAESIPDDVAAMLESFAVSAHATERVPLREDDVALVIGPGPIGLGVVAALKARGVHRILVSGLAQDAGRMRIAKALGASRVFDAGEAGYADVMEEETGGAGVDVVFDCSGHPKALADAVFSVRRGGAVVLVGIYGRPAELPANAVVRGEVSVVGTYGTTPEAFRWAVEQVEQGIVDLRPMITHVVQLEQADAGFHHALSKEGCKVVLKP